MPRRPDPVSRARHRALGRDLFNYTWSLLDRPRRTAAEDDEMLHAAHASRYHWGHGAGGRERAIGEWQLARVYAVLGRAEPATFHARRSLALARRHHLSAFYVAYGWEALARAAAVAGDARGRDRHLTAARKLLPKVRAPDERRLLETDLDAIARRQ